jgi:hypothetical protein
MGEVTLPIVGSYLRHNLRIGSRGAGRAAPVITGSEVDEHFTLTMFLTMVSNHIMPTLGLLRVIEPRAEYVEQMQRRAGASREVFSSRSPPTTSSVP